MAIYLSYEDKPKYEPLEAGAYPARCYGLVVTGTEYSQTFDKTQLKGVILWELPTEVITGEDANGQPYRHPRTMSGTYAMSLAPKANLRKTLDGWRGRPFTPEELARFDISAIIGAPCLLNIIVETKDNGDKYNRITGVSRVPKGLDVPPMINEPIEFDIRDTEQPLDIIKNLPEWLQKRIEASDEYVMRTQPTANDETEDLPW